MYHFRNLHRLNSPVFLQTVPHNRQHFLYLVQNLHFLAKYSEEASLSQNLSPHKLRHFLLTWLKKQGIDDALIQPYSGHESRKSLEVYSKLAITAAQAEYNDAINRFPI